MSLTSSVVAKTTPGTRILPNGSICHSDSDTCLSLLKSILPPGATASDVHHALGDPGATWILLDRELGIGGALGFHGRLMPDQVHLLSPGFRAQCIAA